MWVSFVGDCVWAGEKETPVGWKAAGLQYIGTKGDQWGLTPNFIFFIKEDYGQLVLKSANCKAKLLAGTPTTAELFSRS